MLSALFNLLGAVGGPALEFGASALSTRKQYKRSLRLQKQQQAWLEKMANSAHQREVRDLRAAGLNPILSAGGNGAATPSGGLNSVALGNDPDFSSFGDMFASLKNADTSAKAQKSQKALNETQADLNKSHTAVNESQVKLNKANTELANAKTAKELNIGKPFEKGGKLFDAISDPNTYKGSWNLMKEFFGGSSSAKSSGDKTQKLQDVLKKARKEFKPIPLDPKKQYFRFDGVYRELKEPNPRYINGKWYYY